VRLARFFQDLAEIPTVAKLARAAGAARQAPTCGALIRAQAERHGDRPCLVFEDSRSLSFAAFEAETNRLAHVLERHGLGKGDVVALLAENEPLFLITQGAAAKRGAIAALLNSHLAGDALRHVIRVSNARVLVVGAGSLAAVAALGGLPGVTILADASEPEAGARPLADELAAAPAGAPDLAKVGLGDVFLYVYTSGTTGYPKPAIVRHAKFTMGGHSLGALYGVGPDDCIYAPLPLYHGYANFAAFAVTLTNGARFASRRRFRASEFLTDVRRHEATGFVYVGELCRYLLRLPPSPADRDHRLRFAAGAGLRPEIWEEFQKRFGIARIFEMYGATEGNVSLMNRGNRAGSVGRPFPFQHDHLKLARVDATTGDLARGADGFLVECGDGEPGELLGRIGAGPMTYDGYAGDPDATERKVLRSAFAAGDAWFRTGDLLRRDAAGWFTFVDRLGDTFRWKGENVSTQEVADLLARAEGVADVCVYGVRVEGADGRAGMAAVALADGRPFDGQAFFRHAEQALPAYARPLFVRIVAALDTTGNFKPKKARYRDEGFDPARVGDPLFVRDDAASTYAPLDAETYSAIVNGRRRL
jgi:fatty-acyl-CoA synthase